MKLQDQKQLAQQALLDARRENLGEIHRTSIRAYGKHHGLDLFAWSDPHPDDLVNTIRAFPFPLVWAGNSAEITACIQADPEIISRIHTLITTDRADFYLREAFENAGVNLVGCRHIRDSFPYPATLHLHPAVVLYTFTGSEKETHYREFEQYFT